MFTGGGEAKTQVLVCSANYSKEAELYKVVEAILRKIKSDYDFRALEMKMGNV